MGYQEQLEYHQERLQAHIERICGRIDGYTGRDHWQLYTTTSDATDIERAVKELNDTLKQCFRDIPNYNVAPANHVIEPIIVERMEPLLHKFDNYGAGDSEGRGCVLYAVDDFFMHLRDHYH